MDTADEVWEQLKIATSKNDIDLVEVLSAKLRKLNNKQGIVILLQLFKGYLTYLKSVAFF